jgi:hypothetical protein
VIGHNTNKVDVLAPILEAQKPEVVHIIEDTMFQLISYKEFLDEQNQTSRFYFVDKTHIFEIISLRANFLSKIKLKFE